MTIQPGVGGLTFGSIKITLKLLEINTSYIIYLSISQAFLLFSAVCLCLILQAILSQKFIPKLPIKIAT